MKGSTERTSEAVIACRGILFGLALFGIGFTWAEALISDVDWSLVLIGGSLFVMGLFSTWVYEVGARSRKRKRRGNEKDET